MRLPFTARLFRRAFPATLAMAPVVGVAALVHHDGTEQRRFGFADTLFDSKVRLSNYKNLLDRPPFFLLPISHSEAAVSLDAHPAGKFNPKLPSISAASVRKSKGRKAGNASGVFVTFGKGVYNVSEFVESHPGGEQLLLAAGGPLEPFFQLFPQHQSEFVMDTLEELRVGNLEADEQWRQDHLSKTGSNNSNSKASPYDTDPLRNPTLIVQTPAPFTAEPPSDALVASHNTPNDLFYVRNHMPVPVINSVDYQLTITGRDGKDLCSLSLEELKSNFESVSVSATVQCAGNRRNELNRVKKVKGGGWELGAISNAVWTGARLSDVLAHATGENVNKVTHGDNGQHVCFEGLDQDPATGQVYAASVPMDVIRRHPDAVLAYEMNGEVLPRDHGFPVRVVIPGVVGARDVKWVGRITLADKESSSHWQQKDYRSFAPDVDWSSVDFSAAPSIQEMPVVSAICKHEVDCSKRSVAMEGYAWSGDGKGIIRVDVSADGGESWTAARLHETEKGSKRRNEVYDWTLWSATVALPKDENKAELVCKAIDSAYNSQPDGAANIWNLRGLLNNAWHRVSIAEDKVKGE